MNTLKKYCTVIVLFLFFFEISAQPRYETYLQPDGSTFQAIERGDEFFQCYETPEGYLVKQDNDGYYRFYDLNEQGKFVKTNFIAANKKPTNLRAKPYNDPVINKSIKKQVKKFNESAEKNRLRFLERQRLGLQKNQLGMTSLNRVTMMPVTTLSVGVLLIEFTDVPHYYNNNHPNGYHKTDFENMLFLNDSYNTTSPDNEPVFGSLRDYFEYQSHGILHITGNVINQSTNNVPQWLNMGLSTSYSTAEYSDKKNLFRDAINAALNIGYNMDYDITAVVIAQDAHSNIGFYTGAAFYQTGNEYGFLPSDFDNDNDGNPDFDYNNWFGGYIVKEREDLGWRNVVHSTFCHIGLHGHEMFHVIGWGMANIVDDLPEPDFSLMSCGYRNGPQRKGECPSDLDPVAKTVMEWAIPTKITAPLETSIDYLEIDNAPNANFDFYQFDYNFPENLHQIYSFIVENRQYNGFNRYCPGWWKAGPKGGILVWLKEGTDRTFIFADNDFDTYQEGMPHVSGGDLGDPFPGESQNSYFTVTSTPNSSIKNRDSFFAITNISQSSSSMSANFYPSYWAGHFSNNSTWVASKSPYYICGDVTFNEGTTLTIEPGVEIIFLDRDDLHSGFNPNKSELTVYGQLFANNFTLTGAPGSSIRIYSNFSDNPNGSGNIIFGSNFNVTFEQSFTLYGNLTFGEQTNAKFKDPVLFSSGSNCTFGANSTIT